jgi:hypothetical protein
MRTTRMMQIGQMVLGAILFAAGAQAAQQSAEMPRVENAKVEKRAVTGTLDATFRELAGKPENAEWIGYSVDQIAGERSVCCGTCNLEKEHDGTTTTTQKSGTVKLEGARQLVVLFRLEAKQVMRIRVAS